MDEKYKAENLAQLAKTFIEGAIEYNDDQKVLAYLADMSFNLGVILGDKPIDWMEINAVCDSREYELSSDAADKHDITRDSFGNVLHQIELLKAIHATNRERL